MRPRRCRSTRPRLCCVDGIFRLTSGTLESWYVDAFVQFFLQKFLTHETCQTYYLLTRQSLFSRAPTRAQLDSLWPPQFRTMEINYALETGQDIPETMEWFFYQWSSVGESDLPVGSYPKELMESDIPVMESKFRLRHYLFDGKGQSQSCKLSIMSHSSARGMHTGRPAEGLYVARWVVHGVW